MDTTIEAEFICKREGWYSNYVFKNLEDDTYIMCTVLPNWEVPPLLSGDTGFLTYCYVEAGQEYTDSSLKTRKYRYTKNYFKDFIKNIKEEQNLVL